MTVNVDGLTISASIIALKRVGDRRSRCGARCGHDRRFILISSRCGAGHNASLLTSRQWPEQLVQLLPHVAFDRAQLDVADRNLLQPVICDDGSLRHRRRTVAKRGAARCVWCSRAGHPGIQPNDEACGGGACEEGLSRHAAARRSLMQSVSRGVAQIGACCGHMASQTLRRVPVLGTPTSYQS